jgi:hypothetical protein
MDDLLQQGVIAYKAGKRDDARKIFIIAVKQSPDSESAWGWMYEVSGDDKERIYCLKQMLRINPKNEKVNQLLNQLLAPPLTPISPSPVKVDEREKAQQEQLGQKLGLFGALFSSVGALLSLIATFICVCFFLYIILVPSK